MSIKFTFLSGASCLKVDYFYKNKSFNQRFYQKPLKYTQKMQNVSYAFNKFLIAFDCAVYIRPNLGGLYFLKTVDDFLILLRVFNSEEGSKMFII